MYIIRAEFNGGMVYFAEDGELEYGLSCAHMFNSVGEARNHIKVVKRELRNWGIDDYKVSVMLIDLVEVD